MTETPDEARKWGEEAVGAALDAAYEAGRRALKPQQALEDAAGNLIIAFRRYCLRTYGKVPSEDDFRAILRDATILAHHPADHSLVAAEYDRLAHEHHSFGPEPLGPSDECVLNVRDLRDLLSQQQKDELKQTLEEDARARRVGGRP